MSLAVFDSLTTVCLDVFLSSSSKDTSWLDSVLGKSKVGVFSADFEVSSSLEVSLVVIKDNNIGVCLAINKQVNYRYHNREDYWNQFKGYYVS